MLAKNPKFAMALLIARGCYFFSRKLARTLIAPGGFPIETPDTLIAFWVIVVERELYHESWARAVRNGERPLIVDVGANAGVFSYFVQTLNPCCEIVAFEPLPAMAARVRSLRERVGMNLTCHEIALSNRKGEAVLETVHGYDGTSHLLPGTASSETGGIRVQTTTLDEALPQRQIVLMKIDVEGFEPEVLEGGRETRKRTEFVIAEAHGAEPLNRIEAALGKGWLRRQLSPCDFLFQRAE